MQLIIVLIIAFCAPEVMNCFLLLITEEEPVYFGAGTAQVHLRGKIPILTLQIEIIISITWGGEAKMLCFGCQYL